jgi:hypothetical protein
MIKVTELMITEDGEVAVQEMKFKDEVALSEYEWFDQLVSQYHLPDDDGPVMHFTDNFGNPFPENDVKDFLNRIGDREGIMVLWSVEYDASYWFVEIDRTDRAVLLTSPHKLLRTIAKRLYTSAA